MSNDKVDATFHPEDAPHVRVYAVYSVEAEGERRYVCPICGPLSGAVLKGHGPNHMVEDASR